VGDGAGVVAVGVVGLGVVGLGVGVVLVGVGVAVGLGVGVTSGALQPKMPNNKPVIIKMLTANNATLFFIFNSYQ
jgi:hypothetical protein